MLLTVAILPLALAAAGDAQQLTCWYLKPAEVKGPTPRKCSHQHSEDESSQDTDKHTDPDFHHVSNNPSRAPLE